MTSLREEIHGVLVKSHFYPTDAVIEAILSKFEKRIDNIVNTTTRYEKGEWRNFYKGFDEAIFKVKEMLK